MDIDETALTTPSLAQLPLGLHDGVRAWKSFDWDALGRKHAKGLISDSFGKTVAAALCPPRRPVCRRSIPFTTVFSCRKRTSEASISNVKRLSFSKVTKADQGNIWLDQEIARLRNTRLYCLARVDRAFTFVVATYNLISAPKLIAAAPKAMLG